MPSKIRAEWLIVGFVLLVALVFVATLLPATPDVNDNLAGKTSAPAPCPSIPITTDYCKHGEIMSYTDPNGCNMMSCKMDPEVEGFLDRLSSLN